jgi:hypothetical protein
MGVFLWPILPDLDVRNDGSINDRETIHRQRVATNLGTTEVIFNIPQTRPPLRSQ